MFVYVRFLQILLVFIFLASSNGDTACLSPPTWYRHWKNFEGASSRFGVSTTASKCLLSHAMKFVPDVRIIGGQEEECYHHQKAANYMARSLVKCVTNSETRLPGRLVPYNSKGSKMVDNLVRSVDPKEVIPEYGRRRCTCGSGCHYCCVLTGIGGENECFNLVCKEGTGFCRKKNANRPHRAM